MNYYKRKFFIYFLFTLYAKNNVKYYSKYIYFENIFIIIFIYIYIYISESLYAINNTYNNNISSKDIDNNTLSINQLILLFKNIYPNKYNNNLLELNTSYFIIEIK